MKQNFAERENEAKNDFHGIRDELKNIEEKHAMRVQLETAVDDLWAQFPSSCATTRRQPRRGRRHSKS